MAKLFFLLSGEHESLPVSEIKAILEMEDYTYETLNKLDQVLRLDTSLKCVELVRKRAALTRQCGKELFNCNATMRSISKSMHSLDVPKVLGDKKSFAVRVRRVKEYTLGLNTMKLEGELGSLILEQRPQARVNLKDPEAVFTGILTTERLVFGIKLAEIPAKPFVDRRPRKKPFFHPSAMPSKIARCMVNLAKARSDDLVLDPFCGTGSMLIEAALVGCRVLGSDVKRRMVQGTIRNLSHFNTDPEGMTVADARDLPFKKVDCVVTDPPYGRSTITLRRTTDQIVKEVLVAVLELIGKGHRICIASPKTLNIAGVGTSLGYKHLESHFVYVHRTLTREIGLFEKV